MLDTGIFSHQEHLRASFEVSDQLNAEGDLERSSPFYRDLRTNPVAAIFTQKEQNWQPGDSGVKYLRVGNSGDLALDYIISFSVTDQGLGDALHFTITRLTSAGSVLNEESRGVVLGAQLPQVALSRRDLPAGDQFDLYRIEYRFSNLADNDCTGSFCMEVTLHANASTGF